MKYEMKLVTSLKKLTFDTKCRFNPIKKTHIIENIQYDKKKITNILLQL